MANLRTHIVMPDKLIEDVDAIAGRRGRSAFITEVVEREVRRRKLKALFDEHPGAWWKTEDHPELKHGSAAWVRKMRRQDERIRNKRLRRS